MCPTRITDIDMADAWRSNCWSNYTYSFIVLIPFNMGLKVYFTSYRLTI